MTEPLTTTSRREQATALLEATREAACADLDPQFHQTVNSIIRLAVEVIAQGGSKTGATLAIYSALLPLLGHDGSNAVMFQLNAVLDAEVRS